MLHCGAMAIKRPCADAARTSAQRLCCAHLTTLLCGILNRSIVLAKSAVPLPLVQSPRTNPLVSQTSTDQAMRSSAASDLGSDVDQVIILERLNEVLDPELDESIVKLGFIRSIVRRGVHVHVVLALPTNWCAITFAYIMAEDIRHALLGFAGIKQRQ